MALTALNRSMVLLLTNQSGGAVAQGDVVIVDSANASSFTTTTVGAYVSGSIGVVLEPNGVAGGAAGLIAFGGYVPKINLSGSASLGDVFKTHSVAKQAVRHAASIVAGDFGEVLGTGTSPAAFLWGQPSQGGNGTITLTTAEAKLSADVNITPITTYVDIISVSLAAGTWLITAKAQLYCGTGNPVIVGVKLWDGTTAFDSGNLRSLGVGLEGNVPLVALVTPGTTTTYKISAITTSVTGTPQVNAAMDTNSAGNNATHIVATKIG